MTTVKEFHLTCAVLESDALTVAMNDKGVTRLSLQIHINDEATNKVKNLTRAETIRLIKLLSVCMFENVSEDVTIGKSVKETASLESDVHRKRAYLYVGIDCIAFNVTTCRQLRDELERGLMLVERGM